MINSKGEIIYTNAEIAYELGISPATVNAIGKRLWGNVRIPHWTLNEAQKIAEYVKSISAEEEAQRLARLHDAIQAVFDGKPIESDEEVRKHVAKDLYLKEG